MPIHSVLIQKLLSTSAHLGRRSSTPHIKPFLYGTRNGMSIIDSDKTLISLRNALHFLSHLSRLGPSSRILFVNTNPLFDDIFDHMTRRLGYGSFSAKTNQYWRLSGFLTNSASPKKFKSRNKKLCFGPVHPPDCVVIVDLEGKSSVVNEAARLQIPVVGLVDTSVSKEVFDKITYPIPCNASVQFVYLFCNLVTKTLLLEQKDKRAAAGEDSSDKAKLEEIDQSAEKKDQSADETKQLKEKESESESESEDEKEQDGKQSASMTKQPEESELEKEQESQQSTDEIKVTPYTA